MRPKCNVRDCFAYPPKQKIPFADCDNCVHNKNKEYEESQCNYENIKVFKTKGAKCQN